MSAIEREQLSAPVRIGADGIPASARRHSGSPSQAFAACAVGAVLLALLASADLPSWVERSSDGPLAPVLREGANRWDEHVARLGLTWPHAALRRTVGWLSERRWP